MPVTDPFDTARRIVEQGGSVKVVEAVLAIIVDPKTSPQVRIRLQRSLKRYQQQLARRRGQGQR